jgi:hypothetical protein
MIRYVRKKSHQLVVILFVHPTTWGTWLWQEADFNGTTSSHMLFHMQLYPRVGSAATTFQAWPISAWYLVYPKTLNPKP